MREIDDFSDESPHLEKKDNEEQYLTIEERNKAFRDYNSEYSIHRIAPEDKDRTRQSESNFVDSENSCLKHEFSDPISKKHNFTLEKYPGWIIRSNEKLIAALNKHWKIIMTSNFNKRYTYAVTYCSLFEALDNRKMPPTPEGYREFAKAHGVHRTTVSRWAKGKKKDSLISQLESLEKTDLYETNISESISRFGLGDRGRPHLVFSINNETLEKADNERADDSSKNIRMCNVEGRHYTWTPSTQSNNLLRAYADLYFYFNNENDLTRLVEDATSQLEVGPMISGIPHLSKLSKQLTGLDTRYISEDTHRVLGVSLHLLCDIVGLSINQLEGKFAKISGANGQGGIRNPKFPSSDSLEVLKARIIGIAVSDCHIPITGSLKLTEGSFDRINRIKKIIDNFGVAYSNESMRKRIGNYEFYIASPLTHALNYWGIPSGDRTIINYGLPDEFRLWSSIARCGYMQEMLAQEGSVDKNGVINWSRSHALFDSKKGPLLRFKPKISQEAIEFLMHSNHMHKYQGIVTEQYIPIGRLNSLKNHSDNHISNIADELSIVVSNYRNRLIDDEKAIATSLGIHINLNPVRISYFEKSNRISIRWEARVSGYESKIRSALIIKPNFDTKEKVLLDWLSKQNENDVQQSKIQLASEGFHVQD